jgi:IS5 family transposase
MVQRAPSALQHGTCTAGNRCRTVEHQPLTPVAPGALGNAHRMGRNHLARSTGDAINAVLAAEGCNFRLLLRWLALFVYLDPDAACQRLRSPEERSSRTIMLQHHVIDNENPRLFLSERRSNHPFARLKDCTSLSGARLSTANPPSLRSQSHKIRLANSSTVWLRSVAARWSSLSRDLVIGTRIESASWGKASDFIVLPGRDSRERSCLNTA